jgi:hypothetical protein
MLYAIIGIGIIMFCFAVISGLILAYDKEDKYPRWLSINWPVLFIIYIFLVGLGYIIF